VELQQQHDFSTDIRSCADVATTTTNTTTTTAVSKLVHRMKHQRSKRQRERKAALRRRQRHVEIDQWVLKEHEMHRKALDEKTLKTEADKTLVQVREKKKVLQEKLALVEALRKLSDVRRKERANTRYGFSAPQSLLHRFELKRNRVKGALETVLKEVETEEYMLTTVWDDEDKHTSMGQQDRNEISKAERRERKWRKWLRKKSGQEQ
jgi:heme-degrading monooxygenase HmoA